MKKYKVTFLTDQGIKEIVIGEKEPLQEIETYLKANFGNFITLSSVEVTEKHEN